MQGDATKQGLDDCSTLRNTISLVSIFAFVSFFSALA
jgi:hypothetical protein